MSYSGRARTQAQREAWRRLAPYKRRLIAAERPDSIEADLSLRSSIVTALENVFGPRVWDASLATLAEGEADEADLSPSGDQPWAMTYEEIGEVFGVSSSRIKQIERDAFRKLLKGPRYYILRELLYDDSDESFREDRDAMVDDAIAYHHSRAEERATQALEEARYASERARLRKMNFAACPCESGLLFMTCHGAMR